MAKFYIGTTYVKIGRGEWPETLWAAVKTDDGRVFITPDYACPEEGDYLGAEHHVNVFSPNGPAHIEHGRGLNDNYRVIDSSTGEGIVEDKAVKFGDSDYGIFKDAEYIPEDYLINRDFT